MDITVRSGATALAAPVHLVVGHGPGSSFSVSASVPGHPMVTKTIRTVAGTRLTLLVPRYLCYVTAPPTFCPATSVVTNRRSYDLTFPATGSLPLVFSATVGPITGFGTSGARKAPVVTEQPYVPTEAVTQNAAPVSRYAGFISARPRDVLVLRTMLAGADSQPQQMTLEVDRGPSLTLTAKIAVSGGQHSTATVSSASGRPLKLLSLHYLCYVPPTPTFCPVKSRLGSRRFTLSFRASPQVPVLVYATLG